MDKIINYLEKLEIDNKILKNRFEDVEVEKLVYFKEQKSVYFYLISKKILDYEIVDKLKNELKIKLKYFNEIKFNITYNGFKKKQPQEILKLYMDNVKYLIKKRMPSINMNDKKVIECATIDSTLKIRVDEFFYNRLCDDEFLRSIKNTILSECGIEIFIKIEKSLNKVDLEKIKLYQEREIRERVKLALNTSNIEVDDDEEYVVDFDEDDDLIFGENVFAFNKRIDHLKEKETVCINAEVFNIDIKELRNGRILFVIGVTDTTNSINCKLFLDDMNKDKVINSIKKGSYLKIKGDVTFDYYQNELVLNINGIKSDKKELREDTSDEKRVELHAHTQMSSMDAVCSTKKLIEQAVKWGHSAIAITDHGVVQAFPEAMYAAKANNIKVIYGVEGYLVDDSNEMIKDANDLDFNQEFVVLDFETTGLSIVGNKITEIGAVKVKNRQIVDTFSKLINPERDIPYNIQELTGITNEMVENSPTIEEVLPEFLDFCGDAVLVAHNADFDISILKYKASELNLECNNNYIDTMNLAINLMPEISRYRLDTLCKKLKIVLQNHHRAVDDSTATAMLFIKFIEMMEDKGAKTLQDANKIFGSLDYKKVRPNHIILLAQNEVGLKNLYKLISNSHIETYHLNPRILKSDLLTHREGLVIGSACESGEIYQAVKYNKSIEDIKEIIDLYDYVEIMPLENNKYMINKGEVEDLEELITKNKKLLEIANHFGKIPVATGDVHFLEEHESVLRKVLKNSKGFKVDEEDTKLHFRTTNEMLDEFSYLGEVLAYELVVLNSNKIADMIEDIKPIPSGTYPPEIEGSDIELREMCYTKARKIYGEYLPKVVEDRLERELSSIIGHGYAVMYIISQKLVTKSLKDGYLVGSRGSVGSSFAATMSDITEVNPLPAHYICENEECKYSYFYEIGEYGSGVDLETKDCPKCGQVLKKDGHDIPFEVFLGFEGDKEPDIDLNFSGEYQPTIHRYTEELFGEGKVYRAGTIGTVADKTAFGYSKKYFEENEIEASSAEMLRLAIGCTGVKKTSGQHPGGVMVIPHYKEVYDFTPIQYPANDKTSGVKTTHFDYNAISGRILKLDILGHDVPTIIRMLEDITGIDATKIPLDDKQTMSLFTSTEALGVTSEEINCEIGSLAIPEFGTKFVRQMLVDTKPTTFAELVMISGLSHGTDVWLNNAQDLVRNGTTTLKEVISTRDDIMNYLIFKGLNPKLSFTIMENVRKGKGLKSEHVEAMKENDVPDWYIWSCNQIKYMFPKAHAVAYVMMSYRLAYCKVHYPQAFYATYFTTKAEDFDADLIVRGKDAIKNKIEEIETLGNEASNKEKNILTALEVAYEMYARNIEILKVDIYESDAKKFKLKDNKLLPPLISIQGMGENAAINIEKDRVNGKYISKEELKNRTKISKTVIEVLSNHGALEGMSEENQLSLF
ncbi:MAG: PolC-type DNA polymerase III [Peptostreptococcaceae bacterium]